MDSIFLAEVSGFFRQKNNLMMNLVLSVIYPFYVLFAGIGGIIKNKSSW
jgi:hypothetical protein